MLAITNQCRNVIVPVDSRMRGNHPAAPRFGGHVPADTWNKDPLFKWEHFFTETPAHLITQRSLCEVSRLEAVVCAANVSSLDFSSTSVESFLSPECVILPNASQR